MFVNVQDKKSSFSSQNPELHLLKPYSDLYSKLGKNKYDKVMTAIYLVYDPKSISLKANRDENEARKDVAENFLKEPKFKWDDYRDVIKVYKEDCRSFLQKELMQWKQELDERKAYINGLSWETDAKQKDSMLLNQDKYFEKYLFIKAKVDEEENVSTMAGQKLSRTEKRGLAKKDG